MTQQNQPLPEGLRLANPGDSQEGQPQNQPLPEDLRVMTGATPAEDVPDEIEDQKGVFQSFSEWFSGASRNTTRIDQLPTIVDSGFLKGAKLTDVAKIGAMTALTNDPNEVAQIITKTIPSIRVQYDKDAEGNIYPILVNPDNGTTAIVDKPGVDLMNVGQFITQAAAFSIGGGQGGIIRMGLTEGLKETALQTTQAAAGGNFDAGNVVAATAMGGGFKAVQNVSGMTYRAANGAPRSEVQGLLASAEALKVPVMTSDIFQPKNWFSRGMQIATESMPVVGTGSMRSSQAEARNQALDDFVSLYRGGSYEELVRAVTIRNQELKGEASQVYNAINPYLDQLSQDGGIPLPKGRQALDNAFNDLTRPGRVTSPAALNMLDDLEENFNGGYQSFQVIKDNIGAWTQAIDSIDPNKVVNTQDKAVLKGVLRSLRDDRDDFARKNLIPGDYEALKRADQTWQDMINDVSSTKMKAIFDRGDVTPEVARGMLFSRNKSDVQRLYNSLNPQGQSTARATFISEIASDLEKQAKGLSPQAFNTKLGKYSDGIDVLFQGERKDEIEGLMNVFEATKRGQDVASGAGSQTFERMQGATNIAGTAGAAGGVAGGFIPWEVVASYASIGGIARMFESPRTRSILANMKGLDPGSDKAQRLATQFNRMLRASMQASPTKGTSEYEKEITSELRRQNNEPMEAQ